MAWNVSNDKMSKVSFSFKFITCIFVLHNAGHTFEITTNLINRRQWSDRDEYLKQPDSNVNIQWEKNCYVYGRIEKRLAVINKRDIILLSAMVNSTHPGMTTFWNWASLNCHIHHTLQALPQQIIFFERFRICSLGKTSRMMTRYETLLENVLMLTTIS